MANETKKVLERVIAEIENAPLCYHDEIYADGYLKALKDVSNLLKSKVYDLEKASEEMVFVSQPDKDGNCILTISGGSLVKMFERAKERNKD